jgi:hypothetical protein
MTHPLRRHPLIQIPIDLIAIGAWVVLAVGVPSAAALALIILVFLR